MLRRLFNRDLPLSGVGANETTGLDIYNWAKMFAPGSQMSFNGFQYQAYKLGSGGAESGLMASNPAVFAIASIRVQLFSEARFQWQQLRGGRPGDLFGNADLAILEEPWAGHTTRDMLAQAELDIVAAGNSYWVRNGQFLQRLDPAHVKLLTAAARDQTMSGYEIGEELIGYAYVPGHDDKHVTVYLPEEVCHYKPIPNPGNRFLGLSWLSPCLQDITTDDLLTQHKQSVMKNGAALSTIVSFDPATSREQFDHFVDTFRRDHDGPQNANKTLFLGGGADVKTVGQTFENLMLQAVQGAGEVRIAAAAGIPAAIVGFSEGLRGSTLNAGNYGEARRRLADATMRPLWGAFASSMQSLIAKPAASRLWFDDRDIAFLREDLADQANILAENAKSVMTLVQAGWEPDAAIEAVTTGDLSRLSGRHLGLYSVQLQPPMAGEMPASFGAQPQPQKVQPAPSPALPVGANNNGN
jgi:phage portal protein BeeE